VYCLVWVVGRGYRDRVSCLEVVMVMEVKNILFKCSVRSWREANWARLSATL